MTTIHGGDIYRNHVNLDFSVNINPLGIPQSVKDAMHQAVDTCEQYPDIDNAQLRHAVSHMQNVSEQKPH